MSGSEEYFIGVDVGGTSIKALLLDSELRPVDRATANTRCDEFPEQVADIVGRLSLGLPTGAVSAVGVGMPGVVDAVYGVVKDAVNMGLGSEVPLRDILKHDLSLPVFIAHDLKLFTLGEMTRGAGRGYRDYVTAAIGTGIGIGVVIDGQIYERPTGDWGHAAVDYRGAFCLCGGRGCLESIASGRAITGAARERVLQESPLLLSMVEGRPELVQAKDVFEAVRKGDGMCTDIVSQAAQALAAGIANLFAILNPEAIIIGGGIAQSADILFPLLRRFIAERGSVCKHVADLIVPAQLGQDAGCIGAGLLAQRSMEVCCGN